MTLILEEIMDEKIFNLLEKMYTDLNNFRKETNERFDRVEIEVATIKHDVTDIKGRVTKIESKIENEMTDKIRGLYDNREVVNDKLGEIDYKMDKLATSINTLTITEVRTNSELIEIKRNLKLMK